MAMMMVLVVQEGTAPAPEDVSRGAGAMVLVVLVLVVLSVLSVDPAHHARVVLPDHGLDLLR